MVVVGGCNFMFYDSGQAVWTVGAGTYLYEERVSAQGQVKSIMGLCCWMVRWKIEEVTL